MRRLAFGYHHSHHFSLDQFNMYSFLKHTIFFFQIIIILLCNKQIKLIQTHLATNSQLNLLLDIVLYFRDTIVRNLMHDVLNRGYFMILTLLFLGMVPT